VPVWDGKMAAGTPCSSPSQSDDEEWVILYDDKDVPAPVHTDKCIHAPVHTYKYGALPARHIRLLKLHPGTKSQDVQCELKDFPLDQCPPYAAISYTWGNDIPARPIYVDGEVFLVRENLFSLLQGVRHHQEHRTVWIDAICINQGRVEERNSQVRQMGQIYSSASYVLAWLGPHSDSVALAFDFIIRAFDTPREDISNVRAWKKAEFMDKTLEERWEALQDICNLVYWTRRWIVQELMLASNVVLQCGHQTIPLSTVETLIQRNLVSPETGGDANRWAALKQTGLVVICQHRAYTNKSSSEPSSLHQLMHKYKRFDCKDPRDKVYAMLNLMGSGREHLQVDYDITIPQLFVNALCLMHFHEGLLGCDIISAGILLKHQLHLQRSDLSPEILANLTNYKAVRDIRVFAMVRGVVARKMAAEAASDIPFWRSRASSLKALPQTTFYAKSSSLLGADTEIEHHVDNQDLIVSRQDLCPFMCQVSMGAESWERRQCIGLASCRVADGDEVWQFHDTGLAFIMRPILNEAPGVEATIDGYVMVGRTFLVRPGEKVEPYRVHERLDEDFDQFSRSQESGRKANGYGPHVREIQLDVTLLLNLVFWADADSESFLPV